MAVVSYVSTTKLLSLLATADPQRTYNVRVLSPTKLSLETETFQPVSIIDLADEKVIPASGSVEIAPVPKKASRRRGEYCLSVFGETTTLYSLKDLLAAGLIALEKHRPGTLDKLSKIKTTTKRIVAHDAAHLYDAKGLSEKYAVSLGSGWWYGTNNSAQETEAWLKRACECAGVQWGGKDFSIVV